MKGAVVPLLLLAIFMAVQAGIMHEQHLCGIVEEHNRLRALHGQPPLVWDEEVAKHAQGWADKFAPGGVYDEGTCSIPHISRKEAGYVSKKEPYGYGENIAWGMKGGMAAVAAVDLLSGPLATFRWYSEREGCVCARPAKVGRLAVSP